MTARLLALLALLVLGGFLFILAWALGRLDLWLLVLLTMGLAGWDFFRNRP
jgi:hypothetical protein